MSHSKEVPAEEEEAFLPPEPPLKDDVEFRGRDPSKPSHYWRLTLEVVMAVMLVALLINTVRHSIATNPSPVPHFSRKEYTFLPDPQYVRDDMLFNESDTLRMLHNWLPLSSEARGYVQIPNHESYDILSDPYMVAIDRRADGPAYMISVFHQLHCLSYIVSHYQQGYAGVHLTEEVAHHSAHCFDYLRQSIMCSGDTNLEGKTETGPGWGSKHMCIDYDALLDWANDNERSAMKWRNALLPSDAIL